MDFRRTLCIQADFSVAEIHLGIDLRFQAVDGLDCEAQTKDG